MFMTYSRECSLNVMSSIYDRFHCVCDFFFFFFQDISRWQLSYGLFYLSLYFFLSI